MIQPSAHSVVDELLDPVGQCLTVEVARRLAGLRAPPQVQEKLDALAEKSAEGTLTAEERLGGTVDENRSGVPLALPVLLGIVRIVDDERHSLEKDSAFRHAAVPIFIV